MSLRVYQSLWAMGGLPYGSEAEWSLPEQIERIDDAGFSGVDIAWTPILPSREAIAHAQAAGVPWGATCFPKGPGDRFEELIETFRSMDPGPRYINLQPDLKVFTVEEGATELRRCLEIAAAAAVPVVVETHRDRMTTDLRFTLQLMDAVPEMRINGDLSHFVVGQEFPWPVPEDDHTLIRRVLERADMFHGRVATREQVQIAVGWDVHRDWLDLFLGWWEHGFRRWRERSGPADDLFFVTELGPPWYAITGPDGTELSDRWEESLLLKREVESIWARLDREAQVSA
ncbi:MAG: hypothetical protein JWQ48_1570 [Conexibacter sp.]|nr:hypothetical protein [Conexibacter sp.]